MGVISNWREVIKLKYKVDDGVGHKNSNKKSWLVFGKPLVRKLVK